MLACVASGSARFRRENWNESKKRNEGGGGFFFCSRSKFRAITRLETLATQATCMYSHMPMHTAEIWKKYIDFFIS